MKYRFKIDTPWGSKGSLVQPSFVDLDLSAYPDLFEPVIDRDPVGLVALWLDNRIMRIQMTPGAAKWSIDVASSLLAAGLDVEKLK